MIELEVFWSLLIVIGLLIIIDFFGLYNVSSESPSVTARLLIATNRLKARYIYILRNRRFNQINSSTFFASFLILFLTLVGCYWLIAKKEVFFESALFLLPVFILLVSNLVIKEEIFVKENSNSVVKSLFYYFISYYTVTSFRLASPTVNSIINASIIIMLVVFFWNSRGPLKYRSAFSLEMSNFTRISFFISLLAVFEHSGDAVFFRYTGLSLFVIYFITLISAFSIEHLGFSSFKIQSNRKERLYQNLISLFCLGKLCLVILKF
ncbi:MAG: hypothetical protein CME65_12365 [Halobacteriovoraceae bacterium]|nr:hypothetical protein [Halobacteriovoraceae bacterium]|tara:strand:- start:8158 stop:8955 length:798 start_codon:yes stop_codon:yes gene_type:complete